MVDSNIRFKENPYNKNFQIQVKSKQISLKSNNSPLLVDSKTGEVEMTHVVTYREVDDEEFLKLFTKNLSIIFNLSAAGTKALIVVCFSVQRHAINKDTIPLKRRVYQEFIQEFGTRLTTRFTEPTFQRGIKDLIEKNVLAKTEHLGEYFINHNLVFNGNRFALTDIIKKVENGKTKRISAQIRAKEDQKQVKVLAFDQINKPESKN